MIDMKLLSRICVLLLLFSFQPITAQHNPYLDKKKKNLPSAKMARENRKHLKRQNKEAKKQMRRSKRDIGRANKRRMKGK
jgi:hypothetical protein